MSTNNKITRKELQNKLGCCYNTACKEYKIIQASLALKRPLYVSDLVAYGIE